MLGLIGTATTGLLHTGIASGYPNNNTINIAGLGTGGRFRRLANALKQIPGVRLVALCDVWDTHLNMAKSLADPKAFITKDYHAVLDRKDIDAVIVASPDHWHVPMTVDACAADKDVYVEKPLTHSLSEGKTVIHAQNKHKRIVQVGTQQRSMPHIQKAYQIVKDGRLGKVHKVHLTWNRNVSWALKRELGIDPKTVDWKRFLGAAKDQPFDEYRFRQWRWFWDFGGGPLTDLMVHWIDVIHWFFGLDHPAEATSIGDHFTHKGLWETPDTIQTLLRYPDRQLQVYFEGTFCNARNAAMIEIMGRDATLYIDRGRYEIHPEGAKGKYEEMIHGEGPRGADYYKKPFSELLHLINWIDSIKSRNKPNTPAEAGVSAVTGAHMGNTAYRKGQVVRWKG
jgi:predicted dehydrogenase